MLFKAVNHAPVEEIGAIPPAAASDSRAIAAKAARQPEGHSRG